MLDLVRTTLHRAITTELGNAFWPIRVQKAVARQLNSLLGEPLCSAETLAARRAPAARAPVVAPAVTAPASLQAAPVMVYHEKDRNQRELQRIDEVLGAREIPYRLLDVTGDEATISFVTREARCDQDELPVVFVAGEVIGTFADLVQADVSGALVRAVFGSERSRV